LTAGESTNENRDFRKLANHVVVGNVICQLTLFGGLGPAEGVELQDDTLPALRFGLLARLGHYRVVLVERIPDFYRQVAHVGIDVETPRLVLDDLHVVVDVLHFTDRVVELPRARPGQVRITVRINWKHTLIILVAAYVRVLRVAGAARDRRRGVVDDVLGERRWRVGRRRRAELVVHVVVDARVAAEGRLEADRVEDVQGVGEVVGLGLGPWGDLLVVRVEALGDPADALSGPLDHRLLLVLHEAPDVSGDLLGGVAEGADAPRERVGLLIGGVGFDLGGGFARRRDRFLQVGGLVLPGGGNRDAHACGLGDKCIATTG
jgi:hypothetical protein